MQKSKSKKWRWNAEKAAINFAIFSVAAGFLFTIGMFVLILVTMPEVFYL